MKFNMDNWIKEINENVPKRYFQRNVPEYRFATYINHSIVLFMGNNYDSTYMFVKRSYEFLEENKIIEKDTKYYEMIKVYLKELYDYLIDNDLVKKELITRFNIKN
jgi:hypothetical protein